MIDDDESRIIEIICLIQKSQSTYLGNLNLENRLSDDEHWKLWDELHMLKLKNAGHF